MMPSAQTMLTVFLVGGLLGEAITRASRTTAPTVDGSLGVAVPVFGLMAAILVMARVSLVFGPMVALPAEVGWVLSTPVGRRGILAPRFAVTTVLGTTGGFLFGLVAGFLTPHALLLGYLASGTVGGWSVVGCCVLVQSVPRHWATARRVIDGALAAVALLMVAALLAPARVAIVLAAMWPGSVWAVGLSAVAIVLTVLAAVRLARLDRHALTAGAPLVRAVGTASSFLDPKVFGDALLLRHCMHVARVRSRPLRGGPAGALLRADLVRSVRRPGAWITAGAATLVPYVAWQTLWPALAVSLHILAAFATTRPFSRGLEQVGRMPALRFSLGVSERYLRVVHLAVPGVVAVLWATVTAPAGGEWALTVAPLCVVGAMATVYRLATRPDLEYTSLLIDTPFGAIPPNLLRQVLRGPALLTAVCALGVLFVSG